MGLSALLNDTDTECKLKGIRRSRLAQKTRATERPGIHGLDSQWKNLDGAAKLRYFTELPARCCCVARLCYRVIEERPASLTLLGELPQAVLVCRTQDSMLRIIRVRIANFIPDLPGATGHSRKVVASSHLRTQIL